MNTWHKRDWKQFYELARRPWQRHRPPRPVYPSGLNRVQPAAGFSLSELDDAGVDLDLAERLGLPVDAGRIGAYGPNVTVLRYFVRSSRKPLLSRSCLHKWFSGGRSFSSDIDAQEKWALAPEETPLLPPYPFMRQDNASLLPRTSRFVGPRIPA